MNHPCKLIWDLQQSRASETGIATMDRDSSSFAKSWMLPSVLSGAAQLVGDSEIIAQGFAGGCPWLVGGVIPFIRKYSTIWP